MAELEQPGQRVQPVGELVPLCAQAVRERADAVQLAGERVQVGPVAEGQHGTDGPFVPPDHPRIDHQHAVPGHGKEIVDR